MKIRKNYTNNSICQISLQTQQENLCYLLNQNSTNPQELEVQIDLILLVDE